MGNKVAQSRKKREAAAGRTKLITVYITPAASAKLFRLKARMVAAGDDDAKFDRLVTDAIMGVAE